MIKDWFKRNPVEYTEYQYDVKLMDESTISLTRRFKVRNYMEHTEFPKEQAENYQRELAIYPLRHGDTVYPAHMIQSVRMTEIGKGEDVNGG